MITPGGIPWYALVLQEPVLVAACVTLLLALIGLVAWLGAWLSGGKPSWRMKALLIAPLAALVAGGASHWLQTRVLADTHTASVWMLMPRDRARPSATLSTWSFSGTPPQRSTSLMLARPGADGGGRQAAFPTNLPAGSPATWPATIASHIHLLYPDMSEADAAAHAATLADWAAFLSALPSPDLALAQRRGVSGPYDVTPIAEPTVRLRPWEPHWVVTLAVGLVAMIIAAMILRRRAAAPRESMHAAAHPA
jgi:hypothetical protein